jgi:hypothetical protein
MIQPLLIIIAILLFLIALFLFFAIRQNIIFESRIKKLEDEKNPHNFSHPSSKMHKDFNVDVKPNVVAEPNS